MSLSDGDKAICMEIARKINKEVLAIHIGTCPYGKVLLASKMFLVGLVLGSGVAGSGITLGLLKMFGS